MIKPKGTQDILPEDSGKWQFVEEVFRGICSDFGFSEVRTPTFEYTELFERGVGETTEIVNKQMYTFDDNSKRSLTLKPEGTAGVIRALIENKLYAKTLPLKLFYETPCFRYEKPQAGRLREFHQFGIEIIGSDEMSADAITIKLGDEFFRRLGITEIDLKINSIGCPDCRGKYREALVSYFEKHESELCETCKARLKTNPMRILDCKSEVCKELAKDAPIILDYICEKCASDFESLKKNLDNFNVKYEVDPRIVRGLDYYVKTAFEFVSRSDVAKATVLGGGRYDSLVKELGGPELPGVGFGLGIERLLSEIADETFAKKQVKGKTLIIGLGDDGEKKQALLFSKLISEGEAVLIDEKKRSLKNQLKFANAIGAEKVIIIGDEEIKKGKMVVRNMKEGTQSEEELLV
jgi:histidyl-tRNA synthetase